MNNWIAMSVSELTTRRGGFNGAREQLEETNAAQKQIKIPKCLTATTHPLNPCWIVATACRVVQYESTPHAIESLGVLQFNNTRYACDIASHATIADANWCSITDRPGLGA
jgi:hypothetical protein